MLTTAAMVDNLAEKVDERVSAKLGCQVLFVYNWDHENCPLYGVAGCPLFRSCLSIEVNGRTLRTFSGCSLLRGVC